MAGAYLTLPHPLCQDADLLAARARLPGQVASTSAFPRTAGACCLFPTLQLTRIDRKSSDTTDPGALGDRDDHMQLAAVHLWSAVPTEFGLGPTFPRLPLRKQALVFEPIPEHL